MKKRILVVDDEPRMRRFVRMNLDLDGYDVFEADNGLTALSKVRDEMPDLVLLDVAMPELDGFETLEHIREVSSVPVIMLTVKSDEEDRIRGLDLGADDYVTKPFSIRQLLARANAFLRRAAQAADVSQAFGPFLLEPTSRRLTREGSDIPLTPKEFGLLELFLRRRGRALTRDEIIKHVWGFDVFVTSRSVDRCVNTLRAKIECDPAQPTYIHTVRPVGYRFEG